MIIFCVLISIFVAGSNFLKPKQSIATKYSDQIYSKGGDGKINFIFELEK